MKNNKTLLIEIKDTHANITLSTFIAGKWAILLHKQYLFRPVMSNGSNKFDNSWIIKMKHDVGEYFPITTISNVSLMINTMGVLVKTDNKLFDYNLAISKVKQIIKTEISKDIKDLCVVEMTINKIEKKETSLAKKISYTYELVSKNLLLDVKNAFMSEGIQTLKLISAHKATRAAVKPYSSHYGFIYNISVEEKFTAVNIFKDGQFINSFKSKFGLDYIYENIKSKMNIPKTEARKMFRNIGNIPPEAVTDNKVIYHKIHSDGSQIIYSKKDLSRYITESVNDIFQWIANNLQEYKENNPTLLFSGEISILKGFEDYAKTSLDMANVQIYRTKLIGINIDTNFTTVGALSKIQNNISKEQENKIQLNREAYWVNSKKAIQSLLSKVYKHFDYV